MRSDNTERLLSAHFHKRNNSENKKSMNSGKEIYLRIPKLKKIKHVKNNSSMGENKTDSMLTDINKNQKGKKNIINIVNNLNRQNDKNNNIGLKVNINQYDIMYYIPTKNRKDKNKKEDLNYKNTDQKNLNYSEYENVDSEVNLISSQTSDGLNSENDMDLTREKRERSNYKNNKENIVTNNFTKRSNKIENEVQENPENGICFDMNKINKKASNATHKEDTIEKRMRRLILHKIKSMNNIYQKDNFHNRPQLNTPNSSSNENCAKQKYKIKKFLSKENINTQKGLNITEYLKDDQDSNNSKFSILKNQKNIFSSESLLKRKNIIDKNMNNNHNLRSEKENSGKNKNLRINTDNSNLINISVVEKFELSFNNNSQRSNNPQKNQKLKNDNSEDSKFSMEKNYFGSKKKINNYNPNKENIKGNEAGEIKKNQYKNPSSILISESLIDDNKMNSQEKIKKRKSDKNNSTNNRYLSFSDSMDDISKKIIIFLYNFYKNIRFK